MGSYIKQSPRDKFNMKLSQAERDQINYIMNHEGIPDASKAIRYCVAEKYQELKQHEMRANNGSN